MYVTIFLCSHLYLNGAYIPLIDTVSFCATPSLAGTQHQQQHLVGMCCVRVCACVRVCPCVTHAKIALGCVLRRIRTVSNFLSS